MEGISRVKAEIKLLRRVFHDFQDVDMICVFKNKSSKDVTVQNACLYVLDKKQKIAFSLPIGEVKVPAEKNFEKKLTIPRFTLSLGEYTLLLYGKTEHGDLSTTDFLYITFDKLKDTYEIYGYTFAAFPLTNYFSDVDRVFKAFEKVGFNYAFPVSWGQEIFSPIVDDDFKLWPPQWTLWLDHAAMNKIFIQLDADHRKYIPDLLNPRISGDEKLRNEVVQRQGKLWYYGERSGMPCEAKKLNRDHVYLLSKGVLEKCYKHPGMGRFRISYKPGIDRLPCFCDDCQKLYLEYLKEKGYKPKDLGFKSWSQVKMPSLQDLRVDASKMRSYALSQGTDPNKPEGALETMWILKVFNTITQQDNTTPQGWMLAQAEDFRDLVSAGVKLTPKQWIALCLYYSWQISYAWRDIKERLLTLYPDFKWGAEFGHAVTEQASDIAPMGGAPWELSSVLDEMGISSALAGSWISYDGYLNCFNAETLQMALGHTKPLYVTNHHDELVWVGYRSEDKYAGYDGNFVNYFIHVAPEQMKEWFGTCLAHGAKGVGLDFAATPRHFWMYDSSCPSGHNEIGHALDMVKAITNKIGPSLKHSSPANSKIGILFGYSRLLRKASADTYQGYKFLHRGFGGGRIEFVHEEEVLRGKLGKYNALYILGDGQAATPELAEKIKEWVREGGILIADIYSGRWNRYLDEKDYFSDIFSSRFGEQVKENKLHVRDKGFGLEENEIISLVSFEDYEKLEFPDKSAGKARLIRCQLNPEKNARTIALWSSGKPAIVLNNYGKGKAIVTGFYLGQESHFALPQEQDKLSRLMAGFSYAFNVVPPACSDNLNYEVGLWDAGLDVKYAIILVHLPHWKWRPREEMLDHSWVNKYKKTVRHPQLCYNVTQKPFEAKIVFQGIHLPFDVVSGESICTQNAEEKTVVSERMVIGQTKAYALLKREVERIQIKITPRTVEKGSRVKFSISLADRNGETIKGCVPLSFRVFDANGVKKTELNRSTSTSPDGKAEVELTIGRNEPSGRWKVEAKESICGRKAEKKFLVKGVEAEEIKFVKGVPEKYKERKVQLTFTSTPDGIILENRLYKVKVKPAEMIIEQIGLKDSEDQASFSEGMEGHLVDRQGFQRIGRQRLMKPDETRVDFVESGPLRVRLEVTNRYGLLERKWCIQAAAETPFLSLSSDWVMYKPLAIDDGGCIHLPKVKRKGSLTTLSSKTDVYSIGTLPHKMHVSYYSILQEKEGRNITVEYPVSDHPRPPYDRWENHASPEHGFMIYPQTMWFDLSDEKEGISIVSSLREARDSNDVRVEEFAAIGFTNLSKGKEETMLVWAANKYPRYTYSIPEEKIFYKRLAFNYLILPHSGGCGDFHGRNPDEVEPGELFPHDLYLGNNASGQPKGLLVSKGSWEKVSEGKVLTITVAEGIGLRREGVILELDKEVSKGEFYAVWKKDKLPIQFSGEKMFILIPEVQVNEVSEVYVFSMLRE